MFSAETVDSLVGNGVVGVDADRMVGGGGEGVNKARRLVDSPPSRRCMTVIGALGNGGGDDMGTFSLFSIQQ